jgi:hypothetical protein
MQLAGEEQRSGNHFKQTGSRTFKSQALIAQW